MPNPYQHLLDDPAELNGREHTAERLTGMAIPWHSDPPMDTMSGAGETIRQRKAKRDAGAWEET